MDKDTKIYFTFGVGYGRGASHEDEFTLDELGYDPKRDKDIEKFLDQEWVEWRSNFIDGGWSFEEPL